jgi:hypothetical protein
MSIRDKYTNPDALRAMYRNPRNPLRNIDEESIADSHAAIVAAPLSGGNLIGGSPAPVAGGVAGGRHVDPVYEDPHPHSGLGRNKQEPIGDMAFEGQV